ncbi:hypothetical protein [Dehalobacterium formicoaceticum]|nr:hypothetical protein [Dehalobacterium formicoaceticum]
MMTMGSAAAALKTIVTWGGGIFFLLVSREMWKIKQESKVDPPWDEDP